MCKVTVLSPVYNKEKTINRTFQSLLRQTCYDFEWLIINDGSTDRSVEIIKSFKTDKFKIKFVDKQNEGLNRTFNLGVRLAQGEFVLRLDPDDYLTDDAIEKTKRYISLLIGDENLCGVVFLTKYTDDSIVGYHPYNEIKRSNFCDYRITDKGIGDRREIVKREVFIKHPMPEIEGEKFSLESLMWNSIADEYDAVYIPEAIYVREYNEKSITASLAKVLSQNPIGTMLAYSQYVDELLKRRHNGMYIYWEIIKKGINGFRFAFCSKTALSMSFQHFPLWVTLFSFLPAFSLFSIDKMNSKLVYDVIFYFRKNGVKLKG